MGQWGNQSQHALSPCSLRGSRPSASSSETARGQSSTSPNRCSRFGQRRLASQSHFLFRTHASGPEQSEIRWRRRAEEKQSWLEEARDILGYSKRNSRLTATAVSDRPRKQNPRVSSNVCFVQMPLATPEYPHANENHHLVAAVLRPRGGLRSASLLLT